ncbi:MAG: glycosyltransferase family 2 protein [Candidatus Saccharimonas sp.]
MGRTYVEKTDWSKWNSKSNNFQKYSHIQSPLVYGKPLKNPGEVSIMILTYKRAHGLKAAVDSALSQEYAAPYTIAVLDDSGFDQETDDLMKEYCQKHDNILYYRHEKNLGQYANWNRACELAPTDWYCLLHDDDILKTNYLTETMRYAKEDSELGLLGVYIDVNDTREGAAEKKVPLSRVVFNKITEAFVRFKQDTCIPLTLKDNIKHIYVMNSTFINKQRALEIGGLDDAYFPSSDFAFAAKMSYYHTTGFLPAKLTNKGVGESESLKQSVCDDSIRCAFFQTIEMCKSLGYSERKQLRKASIAAVISEIGVKGYNDVDYGHVKEALGMKKAYNNPLTILAINLYSKFNWGMLIFRKSLH